MENPNQFSINENSDVVLFSAGKKCSFFNSKGYFRAWWMREEGRKKGVALKALQILTLRELYSHPLLNELGTALPLCSCFLLPMGEHFFDIPYSK